MKLIDTHCHLSKESYGDDLNSVIEKTKSSLSLAINVGVDIKSSLENRAIAEEHENIYFTAGIHPNYSNDFSYRDILKLEEILQCDKAVAVGEIGLDYYRDIVPMKKQKEAFETQIELARTLNLPVVIHGREAYEDIFNIIDLNRDITFILHSYAGTYDQLPYDLNKIYISFSGIVTFKSAKSVQECARMVPIDRILVETDAPYLAPQPFRGRKNYPEYVSYIAEKISKLRDISYDEVVEATNRNSRRAFKIKETP